MSNIPMALKQIAKFVALNRLLVVLGSGGVNILAHRMGGYL